jgi:hypothetical protein
MFIGSTVREGFDQVPKPFVQIASSQHGFLSFHAALIHDSHGFITLLDLFWIFDGSDQGK